MSEFFSVLVGNLMFLFCQAQSLCHCCYHKSWCRYVMELPYYVLRSFSYSQKVNKYVSMYICFKGRRWCNNTEFIVDFHEMWIFENCTKCGCVNTSAGMTDKMIAILIKKHEAETEDLKQKQARNRQNQEIKLKVCL